MRQNFKFQILSLLLLCTVAFFLRSYAIYRDFFFAYDQGRDAWEMQKIARGDLTLIGPVTGLEGVFVGPFWYYLIFPAYWISSGNPVASAYEMIFFAIGTIVLLYLWGKKLGAPWAGLIAGTFYTFSFQNILFSRWVANPTPLAFFALAAFYILYIAIERHKAVLFFVAGIVLGLCFQLEAANATWFIPTVVAILGIEAWLKFPSHKQQLFWVLTTGLIIAAGFILAETPHILFELKHDFLITRNAIDSLRNTQDITLLQSLPKRIPLLFSLYGKALFRQFYPVLALVGGLTIYTVFRLRKMIIKSLGTRILLVWFCVPFFFHTIFTGNHGNFWDYYVIAQHPVLYLILGISFVWLYTKYTKKRVLVVLYGGVVVLSSVIVNFWKWTEIINPYAERFALQMQVDGTNWIIDQAKGERYGVWVYTPSAQDEAHRYVFWWIGQRRGVFPQEHVEQEPLIFLVVEHDGFNPKRQSEWVSEKMAFGKLEVQKQFGAITVYKLKNDRVRSIVTDALDRGYP